MYWGAYEGDPADELFWDIPDLKSALKRAMFWSDRAGQPVLVYLGPRGNRKTVIKRVTMEGMLKLMGLAFIAEGILKPKSLAARRMVRLRRGNKTIMLKHAVIDTGADVTVIGLDVASALGLDIAMLARTKTLLLPSGRLPSFRAPVDRIEIMDRAGKRAICSIGPVAITVAAEDEPMAALIGSDILSLMRAMIYYDTKGIDVRCRK